MPNNVEIDVSNLNLLARLTLAVGYCGSLEEGKTAMQEIISNIGEQCFKQFCAELVLVDQEKLGKEMFSIISQAFNEYADIKKGN